MVFLDCMQMTHKGWIMKGIILVIIVGIAVGILQYQKTRIPAFPINSADTIASWSFKGAYAGNDTLIQNAQADIIHLTSLLGKGEFDDYDLYDGMANDYTSLGDGENAYANYNRAIAIHPKKGLGYVNLGYFFDQLGASHTAADAYTKAVTVEPSMLQYRLELLRFLTIRFATDIARVNAAFADSDARYGAIAEVLIVKAQWLTTQGKYADAIDAWEKMKEISPGRDMTSVDTEIARLKAKL